eukprot:1275518-Pleurochrysis_carterae.AAC.1
MLLIRDNNATAYRTGIHASTNLPCSRHTALSVSHHPDSVREMNQKKLSVIGLPPVVDQLIDNIARPFEMHFPLLSSQHVKDPRICSMHVAALGRGERRMWRVQYTCKWRRLTKNASTFGASLLCFRLSLPSFGNPDVKQASTIHLSQSFEKTGMAQTLLLNSSNTNEPHGFKLDQWRAAGASDTQVAPAILY